ncbi:MAG: TRAP transporter small permease [Deltaproteobacteria bacterium]|nr:TRAP transporter small permease [Deltaproteobacteria bacterium]
MPDRKVNFWSRIGALIDRISGATGLIGAISILAAAVIVTEGVVVRKVLGQSTVWQIESSVFLLMYACFVGAALGQRKEHHLNVDLVVIHLKPRTREMVLLVTAVLSCLVCLILAFYAWPMWWHGLVAKEHSESLWGPPLWIPYLFLPLGLSLVFLQYLAQIVRKIKALREGTYAREVVRQEIKDVDIPSAGGRADE